MGWRGAIRSFEAATRRAARDAERRERFQVQRGKLLAKMAAAELAQAEAAEFEQRITTLLNVHRDCGESWNWAEIAGSNQPIAEPTKKATYEQSAQFALLNYHPSWWERFTGKDKKRKSELQSAVSEAVKADKAQYQAAQKFYETTIASWRDRKELAEHILAGDPEAYILAIKELAPFAEISEIGCDLTLRFIDRNTMAVSLSARGEDIVPAEEKRTLSSGKLSKKAMTKARFYEIYQDYICGCVLRVAREVFALLPVTTVIVTAKTELLDTSTGALAMQPILSVNAKRQTIECLNFEALDPSDAMKNFIHNMGFKRGSGFSAVAEVIG